jgi:hypothetical protein
MHTIGSLSLSHGSQFCSMIQTLFSLLKNGLPNPHQHKHTHTHEIHAPDFIHSHWPQQKNYHTLLCTKNTSITQSQFLLSDNIYIKALLLLIFFFPTFIQDIATYSAHFQGKVVLQAGTTQCVCIL